MIHNKVGYYPGSFHPWHDGHEDVLKKALVVFDRVMVAYGVNPEKAESDHVDVLNTPAALQKKLQAIYGGRVRVEAFEGLMVDEVNRINHPDWKPTAIIRGLRNGYDLQYEANQQYWNEDLGLTIPVVFFITDRKLAHISSSSIRAIAKSRANTSRDAELQRISLRETIEAMMSPEALAKEAERLDADIAAYKNGNPA